MFREKVGLLPVSAEGAPKSTTVMERCLESKVESHFGSVSPLSKVSC